MYKTRMFIIFIFSIFVFGKVNAFINDLPLLGKIIYLDAGHGGKDPGAYYKDIYEDDINLSITLKLKEKLESLGATIYLTRNGDYDLSTPNVYLRKKSDLGNRANMINSSNADIYLSLHLNSSSNSSWNGAQVFYDDINDKNKNIAKMFQNYFNKYLNSNREAKEIKNLYMYKRVIVPGVLLELGFISNKNERYLLTSNEYQKKIINVLSDCLIEILL